MALDLAYQPQSFGNPDIIQKKFERVKVFNEAFLVTTNVSQTSSKTSWYDTVVSQHLNVYYHY